MGTNLQHVPESCTGSRTATHLSPALLNLHAHTAHKLALAGDVPLVATHGLALLDLLLTGPLQGGWTEVNKLLLKLYKGKGWKQQNASRSTALVCHRAAICTCGTA